ncbi:MAG: hypothetical protein COA44_00680 [Arcobacter sp.]|nr:MAG: hypothetical protein COA44_00680 [Arcobacter sp.]
MQERIQWLDSYRGILISSIVFIHILDLFPIYNPFMEMFSGMRMPAFFFISGFLLSDRYTAFSSFFKHRFRQLIVPYFIFFILTLLFWNFFDLFVNNTIVHSLQLLKGMIYGVPSSGLMLTAAPLWFVVTLFLSEMYYITLKIYIKSDLQKLFILILFSLVTLYLSIHLKYRLPWNADIAFLGAVFYGLGNITKKYNLLHYLHIEHTLLKLIVIIFSLGISIWLSLHSTNDYARNIFNNMFFTLLSAGFGIISLVLFSSFKPIKESQALQYLGINTYVILAFHNIPIKLFSIILLKLTGSNTVFVNSSIAQLFTGPLFLVILLFSMMPLIYIINKKAPMILNK